MIAELTMPSRLIHGGCAASMPSDLSNDWQTFGKDGIFWTRFVHLGHDAWSNAWIYTIYHLPFRGLNVLMLTEHVVILLLVLR
jgi:hypothetical protein